MKTLTLEDVTEAVSKLHAQWQTAALQLPELSSISIDEAPKTKVWEQDKVKLFHYEPVTKHSTKVPLLIVYAMVNRPYVLDLQPDRSLIRNLLAKGHDIYLLDWGYPDHTDTHLTLEDFIEVYFKQAVNWICEKHHLPSIHLLGVCQGGTLSLCFTALHQKQIRSLITMVTPVDFHTSDNLLTHICQNINIDLLVDTMGNLSGQWLNALFLSLKPYKLMSEKYVQLLDKMDNSETLENFLRMEKWIFDSPDVPAEAARKFVKELFQQNKLIKGTFYINHQKVDLKKLKLPIFNIYALQDHLVPPASSMALSDYISSIDYEELAFQGGHIGIYVSQRAQQHIAPAINKWLHEHS
jgi:polyhydroxyalkanoate synthase